MNRQFGLAAVLVTMGGALVWACSDNTSTPTFPPDAATTTSGGTSGSTSGGTSSSGTSGSPADATTGSLTAKANIRATSDASAVEGTAEFVENGGATQVSIAITSSGGTPGDHGIHIHDKGNCDPVDGGAGLGAGGHWNPGDAGHGYPGSGAHHLGDLGNITIDGTGKGSLKLTFPSTQIYVREGPNSVVGHAIVYHAQKDDGISQPVGDAGARPGCGVITKE